MQSTDTTLVHRHEQQTKKVKHKSKGREMQTQEKRQRVIEEDTEELGEKPLRPLQEVNRFTRQ